MRLSAWLLLACAALASGAGGIALAGDAKIMRDPKGTIPGLAFPGDEARIRGSGAAPQALLQGTFARPGWSLMWRTEQIATAEDGRWKMAVPLTGQQTYFQLTSIGPRGELVTETLKLETPDWEEHRPNAGARAEPPNALLLGAGGTLHSYTETRKPDARQYGVTTRLAYRRTLRPRTWEAEARASFTATPLGAPAGRGYRMFSGEALASFSLPSVRAPWRLSILAGAYYRSMIVPGAAFGFTNVFGPRLFPSFSRALPGGSRIGLHALLSPVNNAFSFFSPESNFQAAGGLSYSLPWRKGKEIGIELNGSYVRLKDSGIEARELAVGLGLTYAVGF